MKKFIAVFLSLIVVFISALTFPTFAEVVGSGVVISQPTTGMYTNAGTNSNHTVNHEESSKIADIPYGTKFDVYGSKLDGDGDKWLYVKTESGQQGYLYSPRVKLNTVRNYNADFEANLQNFPSEYHNALRALHNEFPNWRFFAESTNCSFEDAVEAEYRSGDNRRPRKFVETSNPNESLRDPRAKKSDGTWENAEGNRWTYASQSAISDYMNPANYLYKGSIFMFLQLSYNGETQTKEALSSVVVDTFLNNETCLNAIMSAAQQSGMSPFAIASLIIIEQGTKGTSGLISGTYPGYEGYYNFFNVGASGASTEEIVSSGLEYAKKPENNWNSIEAAIVGGAKFCANGYIASGQDTYYYMDYNVVKGDYNNQYAASVYDAYNKGAKLVKSLTANKNATLDFVIPVYTSTPLVTINRGDINHDNQIDIIDAAIIRKHILGIAVLDVSSTPEADINKDGAIDIIDAAIIRKHILGIELIGG